MGGLVLTLGGLLWLGIGARAESVLRLSGSGDVGELRVSNLPQVMETVRIYFPLGAGFGTFDPVFRILEPDSSLTRKYFNHAHNDWIELIITGGVPAVLVLVAFMGWFTGRVRALTAMPLSLAAASGIIIVVLTGLASAADYPLRTPLISTLFACACCWLCRRSVPADVTPVFHPAATRDRPVLSRMSAGEATGGVNPARCFSSSAAKAAGVA